MPTNIDGGTQIPSVVPDATPVTALTSADEIQRVFSVDGVQGHTDDVMTSAPILSEIIQRASETVLQYLRVIYDPEDLSQSFWARSKATYIACYLLSIRMGNPALYQDQYEMALLDLDQARMGTINIGLPATTRVVVQTQTVDRRAFHQLRVNSKRSTHTYGNQRLQAQFYGYDY